MSLHRRRAFATGLPPAGLGARLRPVALFLFALGGSFAALPAHSLAQTRTWTATNAGNLLTNSNWSGGAAPNAVGAYAEFDDTKPTGGTSFTLNGSMTLGTIDFYNPNVTDFTGTGTLTMNVSSGNPLIYNGADWLTLGFANLSLADTTRFSAFGVIWVDSLVSGGGGILKQGSDILEMQNAANSYTGLNTISAGQMAGPVIANSGSNSSFGRGNFAFSGGGTLDYYGPTASTNRTFSLGSGGGVIEASGPSATLTLAGVISGTGGLTTRGGIQLNAANTYGGSTLVNTGTLRLGAANRIPNGTALSISSGATLDLNGFAETIGSLAGAGSVTLGGGTLTTGGSNATTTYSGVISESGSLVKMGTGMLSLSGANSYTGTNTISDGTLSGSTIANSGSNSAFGRGSFSISNGARMRYSGATASTNRTFTLGTGGGDIEISTGGTTLTLSGAISGTGPFAKAGAGVLNLTAANTYSGATSIEAGTLRLGASERLPDATAVTLFAGAGATLDLNGFTETIGSLAGAGAVSLGSGTLITGGDGSSTTYSAGFSGAGNVTKTGAGVFTLEGLSSFTGTLNIQAGTVSGANIANVDTDNAFGRGNIAIANGAILGYTGIGSPSSNHNIALGAGGGRIDIAAASLAHSGVISGTGPLVKIGAGLLQLGGDNTYSGATSVEVGTLRIGAFESLPDGTALSVAAGAVFDLNTQTETIGSLAGAGSIDLGFGSLTTGGDGSSTTFSGAIAGPGQLTKTGAGLFTLSGLSSFTGSLNVAGGTLSGNTIGNTNVNSAFGRGDLRLASGATVRYTGATAATDRELIVGSGGGVFDVTSAATELTFNGPLTASGALTKTGAGTLAFGVGAHAAADLNVTAGVLKIAGGGELASAFTTVDAASGATLAVTGAGSTWDSSEIVTIGASGVGSVEIRGGALATGVNVVLGNLFGSQGSALVRAADSRWEMSSNLLVGAAGTGDLRIENGGRIEDLSGIVGSSADGVGTATVTGAGSTWAHIDDVYVGFSGEGTLLVEAGGTVENAIGFVGRFAGSDGDVTVTGASSLWRNTDTLNVGGTSFNPGGAGAVTVASGGRIEVGNLLRLGSQGVVNLEAGGTIETMNLEIGDGTFNFLGGVLDANGTVTGPVFVPNGGRVTGAGSYDELVVGEGATVAPGNSPGFLSSSLTTWDADGEYEWEISDLDDGAGIGWDVWDAGALDITATSSGQFAIQILTLDPSNDPGALTGWDPQLLGEWLIATSTNGAFTASALQSLSLETAGFSNELNGGAFSLASADGGDSLLLLFTPEGNEAPAQALVPEPGTGALLALGALGLFVRRRHSAKRV